MLDYLIVGQGLAGTLLAYFLQKEGQKVLLIDKDYPRASSKFAAGIINPVTGRRYVKSWLIEDLLPFAKSTYQAIEKVHGISIFHEIPLVRALFNPSEGNNWMLRLEDPTYVPFMKSKADLGAYQQATVAAYGYGEVLQSARLDIPAFVNYFRSHWTETGEFIKESFQIEDLEIIPDGVQYHAIKARQVVFCEGIQATQNPFFNYLPFNGSKGEILEVAIPDVQFESIFKHKLFIVPLANGNYWIGATNDKIFDHDLPTERGAAFLYSRLKSFLKTDFEIVGHYAAVRPTVRDRRPFLGRHPNHPQLAIFNGLGTKGASLAPFWAHHFVQHLLHHAPIDKEVDINRIKNFQ
ncbi:MAG: FAD-dependent oxidoreductase [Saprospiraceae bacterium]